ncbi:endothelin-converting enzyme 1 [Hyalella azteca]|uniref:Endothelin-converting enzyme 1 n=1 Tax=Hyalella azteca TaxID=294128 RepID=A0A8B7NRX7_HYAAZ|nr:endothelin-converting enzyme 1 [Hyalella azteca]
MRDYLGSSITDAEVSAEVEDLLAFETTLAKLMVDAGADNVTELLERMTVDQVQAALDSQTPGQFNLLEYIRLVFEPSSVTITADEVIYLEEGVDYISRWSTLLSETPTRVLANFMSWMWVLQLGTQTTYAMRKISSDFEEIYFGAKLDQFPRADFCRIEMNQDLGFVLSRAYVDEFFPAGAKEENEQLVEDVRSSFNAMFDENTWLTPEDLVTAREKLQAVESIVAYPEWIMDDATFTAAYEGLEIVANDQFGNLVHIGQYMELYECEIFRTEPQTKFILPPTVVNAFYYPTTNSITILAGILQIPFYQHNSLAALNYGGIGMIIGHELTHGFDNSGRNYDKDGNLALWWSQESIQAFNERAQCFVDQYDAFHPPEVADPTVMVDGQQTLGENIADNGGIREAFLAYQRYVDRNGVEPALPGLDEFTSEQLFYLEFANLWCESRTESSIMRQLRSDGHSPGRFRTLGTLGNDAEFSRVWKCPAGSKMNRGDQSCVLW